MKVLVTGAGGQLASELQATVPAGIALSVLGRARLDVSDAAAVGRVLAAEAPDLLINAAAYTAVDRAEAEPLLAQAVNGDGPGHLARSCRELGIRLLHVSTDFVFNGEACHPYRPDDRPDPVSAYGASKFDGERQVQAVLGEQAAIVRTAWVYSRTGNNFVKTMLRLMRERDRLRVVADQVGTPTWAQGLAQALWQLAGRRALGGVFHWTDAGVASWYDFAVAIQEEALARGLLARAIPVEPIRSVDYPTPARRPAWSVLDKTDTWQQLGCTAPHWREALRSMLQDLQTNGETL